MQVDMIIFIHFVFLDVFLCEEQDGHFWQTFYHIPHSEMVWLLYASGYVELVHLT